MAAQNRWKQITPRAGGNSNFFWCVSCYCEDKRKNLNVLIPISPEAYLICLWFNKVDIVTYAGDCDDFAYHLQRSALAEPYLICLWFNKVDIVTYAGAIYHVMLFLFKDYLRWHKVSLG